MTGASGLSGVHRLEALARTPAFRHFGRSATFTPPGYAPGGVNDVISAGILEKDREVVEIGQGGTPDGLTMRTTLMIKIEDFPGGVPTDGWRVAVEGEVGVYGVERGDPNGAGVVLLYLISDTPGGA